MRKLKLFLDAKAANTPPRGISKASRVIFSFLTLLLLSIGQVWGNNASITFASKGLTNGVQYTDPFVIDDNVSVTFGGGANDGKYYDTGSGIRTYSNGTITINGGEGVTISAVGFTFSGSYTGTFSSNVGTYSSPNWTGSASTIVFTNTASSGHSRLQAISITYTTSSNQGGSETADVIIKDYASAHSWANGTKYGTVTVDDNVTVTATGGNNTSKYYTAGYEWRMYQTENPTITVSTTSGTLNSVMFTYNVSNTGTLKLGTATVESGKAVNVSGQSATFSVGNTGTATKGQVKITAISVNYTPAEASSVKAPTFSVAAGVYAETKSVELACETDGATIYYTTDGSAPDNTKTQYTTAISVSNTQTIKAIAYVGSDASGVASAEYTILTPQTDMDQIFAVASADNGVAKPIAITFNNWVVSGAKGKTAYVTDGEKGFIIFYQDHGFTEGDILSGTAIFTIQLYNGAAELTEKISGTVNAATGGTATLNELDAEGIADLGGVNTGALINISGTCSTTTGSSTKYYIGEDPNKVQLYTTLHDFTSNAPASGKDYNCTGVYVQFNSTKEIMPRKADDIQLKTSKTLSSISLSGTYKTVFEQDDEFTHAGLTVTANYSDDSHDDVTASATFTGYDMSATGEQTVTVHYSENATEVTKTYTITVNTPASTGEWELFEGELSDLTAGNYLIYDNGSAMLAQISSNRFAYETETPDANGIISNPSGYAVWTLAKSGDYWTFYNAKAGKYAAGNGTKNQGALNADGTVDASLWSISNENGIVNKGNAASSVNATLRHNEDVNNNYGFACYGSTTGNQPVFYKPATPSYYITETLTGCSAADGNATKVPQSLSEEVVLKYNLATGYVWPNAITVEVNGVELNPDDADYLWETDKTPAVLTIDQTLIDGDIVVTIVAQLRELENITVKEAPTKTAYFVGDFFNPAGLEIQLNYTAGDPDIVVYNDGTKDDFSFSPDLETALTADDDEVEITYAEKSVSQTISVTVPTPEEKKVVIIAEYDSKFYAMSNAVSSSACAAIEVTKDGANLVAASDDDKAAIQWLMTTTGNNVTFQNASDKYLSSVANDGALSLVDGPDNINWSVTEEGGEYLIAIGDARALLYRTSGLFKHYATSNLIQHADEYFKVSEIFEVAEGATNIVVVTPVVREFVVDPDEAVAFGTVDVDETVAPKSFSVTLTGIASATVTLSDDAAFSIDVTALTADGTITVTPKTENAGNFSATITLSDDDNLAADKVINVTMKVVEPKDCDGEDDFNTVSDASGYDSRTSTAGWSAVNTAVSTVDEVTYWVMQGNTSSVGVITSPELNNGIGKLTLDYMYPFSEANGVSFKVEIKQNGALVEGKSYTITNATAVQNTVYSETIENINVEGEFQIVITNLSPSSATKSKDRFGIGNLCWKNYTAPEPQPEVIRDGLEAGKWGTLCPTQNISEFEGATFYQIAYLEELGGVPYNMVFDEIEGTTLTAGKPYFFIASASEIRGIKTGTVLTEAGAGVNGFYGYIGAAPMDLTWRTDYDGNENNTFVIYNNSVFRITGGTQLKSERCYININSTEPSRLVSQPAPGRRRINMAVTGTNVATGIDAIDASEKPMKLMIDGQIYILRGEKLFDTTGRLVK